MTLALLAGCGTPEAEQPLPEPTASQAPGPTDQAEALVAGTDAARSAAGLEPLEVSACLARAARRRAQALVGRPLEHRPLVQVAASCAGGGRVAENLVRSSAPADDVVEAWLGSPGHRNNLLDPRLGRTGIGCVPDGAELICSQLFAEAGR